MHGKTTWWIDGINECKGDVSSGGNMKRFFWLTLLLVLVSVGAVADSVKIDLFPNDGSGDNFGASVRQGSQFTVVFGGTPPDFLSGTRGHRPGDTVGGSADLFVSGGRVKIHGTSFDLEPLEVGSIFMTSFVLPTNGKDFTAKVMISFSALMLILDTDQTLPVGGSASGHIKFHFEDGTYFPDEFIQTPEPGTLGLLGTGLATIAGLMRRKRNVPTMR